MMVLRISDYESDLDRIIEALQTVFAMLASAWRRQRINENLYITNIYVSATYFIHVDLQWKVGRPYYCTVYC